jgi:glycosyltransferase involved in cell wall biosynthesis
VRILLANDHATPMGGAEIGIAALRDGLRARGHTVDLLASTATSLPVAPDADHLVRGTMHPRGRVLAETWNPSALAGMRRAVRTLRPDVVHLRLFLTQLSPSVLLALRDVPTVHQVVFYKPVCPRGTKLLPDGSPCTRPAGRACLDEGCTTAAAWPFAQLQRHLYHRWSDRIDAVTTLTEAAAGTLATWGMPGAEVIGNGITPGAPRPPLADPPVIGFAGRLVADKGPDLLLEAFVRLAGRHPTARLVLVGDGPLRAQLAERAAAAGLADRVDLPGHVDRDEVERCLAPAWVQVVPGRWAEPFGTVTLEAAGRGTAVVASDVGGPGELVRTSGLGRTFPPGDVGALTAVLDGLLADRDGVERVGAAARAAVLRDHTHDRVVDRYEALYERLTTTPRPRPAHPRRPRSRR